MQVGQLACLDGIECLTINEEGDAVELLSLGA